MGERLRLRVFSVLGVLAAGATVLGVACGGDDGGVDPSTCEGPTCDGGASSESSTTDSPSGTDASTASDAGGDGDADSAVTLPCADAGPPGTLDESFGDGGTIWLTYPTSGASAVVVQGDGKIVIGGHIGSKLSIIRLLPNGSLDATFGSAGVFQMDVLTKNNAVKALALQADGKIVAAAEAHATGVPAPFVVTRQGADGGLDPSFGDGGVILTTYAGRDAYASTVLALPDGKLLVSGYSEDRANPDGSQNYEVVRYNADGSLDVSFGNGGKATIDIHGTADTPGVAALVGGKVIVAGGSGQSANLSTTFDVSAARLNPNGSIDPSFADAGSVLLPGIGRPSDSPIRAGTIDSAGRILLAGALRAGGGDDFGILRLGPTGSLDPTFGDGGVSRHDFSARADGASALLIQSDGKLVLVGGSVAGAGTGSIAVTRFLSNGDLDPSFGNGGVVLTPPPLNADLDGTGAAMNGCTFTTVGTWIYDQNTGAPKTAIGIARYRQ